MFCPKNTIIAVANLAVSIVKADKFFLQQQRSELPRLLVSIPLAHSPFAL